MALDAAVEAGEIVDALRPFGIKQQEIADVVHVSDRAVRAWRTGSIQGPRYDRLAELRDLVSLLSDSLTPRGVGQWLRSLGGERPLDVLREGDFERVEKAARSFVEGGYV
jgi:transcriptional regulator with XRE-family HTH domain